jgi:hypothetical protein
LKEVVALVDYNKFISSEDGKIFYEKNRNKIIDLSTKEKRSLVITDRFFYLTSYVVRSFQDRGNEFERLKEQGKRNIKKYTGGL